jgi:hypothetical protein
MTCNVGTADRVVRAVAGLSLVAAGVSHPQWWWLSLPGAGLLVNAALGRCGLYQLLGISTAAPKAETGDGRRASRGPG